MTPAVAAGAEARSPHADVAVPSGLDAGQADARSNAVLQYLLYYGRPTAGMRPAAAAADDRIDALLVAFVQYGTATWPHEFTKLLASAGGRTTTAGAAAPAVVVAAEHRRRQ